MTTKRDMLPDRLRWYHLNSAGRPGVMAMAPLVEAAEEIERLRAAIVAWADEILASEGVLFLPDEPHRSAINAVIDNADVGVVSAGDRRREGLLRSSLMASQASQAV